MTTPTPTIIDELVRLVEARGFYRHPDPELLTLWTCDAWRGWYKTDRAVDHGDRMHTLWDLLPQIALTECGDEALSRQ